jgi:hypothetical protein
VLTASLLLCRRMTSPLKPGGCAVQTLPSHLVRCDAADCKVVAGGAGKVQAADGSCWRHGEGLRQLHTHHTAR